MKKRQLSQKKISHDADKSQTKISSFFRKVPKGAAGDDKVVPDQINSESRASIERKRKERDNSFEEFCASINKKRNVKEEPLKEHCIAKTESFESHNDSVLSILKDFEEPYSNFKENEVTHKDAILQKVNKKEGDATMKSKQIVLQNTDSIRNISVSDVTHSNNHVLKKQDSNTIVLNSSLSTVETSRHEKAKLHDLKKVEPSEDFLMMMNGDELDDFFDQEWHAKIDFTTLQRCKIIDVKHESKVTVLTVQHVESENIDAVACSGFWKDAHVEINDIVTIQATKDSRRWIVDNNNGFLVTQPDLLISGTTITGGLFCNRRAVLTEKFRKIESLPNLDGDCSVMTVGSLVHQWLQKALRENICALSDVIKLLDNILQSKDTLDYLYASEMSLVDCRKRMMEYAPRIFEFIQHYIKDNKQQHISNLKDNFRGSINSIQDIEETVYIPKLGMKGRIDVTAEVNINSRRKIMPLEVKTGRASYSLEHKGQVILYLMMMGFRDQDIDTGLLLYLKENSMQEIKSGHHEKRDLILLRNTLARYFDKKPEGLQSINSASDLKMMELPEPINHRNACSRCPYQTLCCAYLARDPNANLSPSHPLTELIKELQDDFETSHLDYVMKWIALMQLEESYENSNSSLSSLWTTSPEKRETRGTCICNLKTVGKVVEQDDRYQHKFARVNIKGETTKSDTLGGAFTENDYIIVSTDARVNIAAGHIMHVSHDIVAVLLDKDITRLYADSTFHIDKYSSTNLSTFNYANVAGLLSNDETSVKLRRIVIDKRPATFVEKLPRSVVSASSRIINDLNENQQRAVLKAVAAREYVLIKGMPGTGKTQTLIALIELLQELGSSVLITASTHSAVDNVLLKLLERNIDFLRIGSTKQIHPLLTCKSEEYAIASCDSPEDLETLYNSKRIVGVTCYGAYHALFRRRSFDVCLVDESAQIVQPTVLRPLYSAHKFVLVGDPDQLPPVIKNKTAVKLGADESLFVRLDSDNNTVNNLNVEFGNGDVTLNQTCSNIWEVAITSRLVQVLTEAGVCARNIGIIAPYNAHIHLLRKIIDKEVEVNTVDRYQGRDKDVIIYSCTKSVQYDTKKEFEILDDQRRLTVAITRARHKLIIIADKVTLLRYTPFKNLFDVIDEKNVINLHDGEEDFSWESLIRRIDNRDKESKD